MGDRLIVCFLWLVLCLRPIAKARIGADLSACLSTGVVMPVRDNHVQYIRHMQSFYTTIRGLQPPAPCMPELLSSFLTTRVGMFQQHHHSNSCKQVALIEMMDVRLCEQI